MHTIQVAAWLALGALAGATEITFNKNFEGASLGRIETLSETEFRCHVEGQSDERGRNRQANWYYFRMDGVRGQQVTLMLTNFVGEYNDRPGSCAMNADTIPVFTYDNERWEHFPAMTWDDERKEATLQFQGEHDTIWIAHVPPYTHARLLRLLEELDRLPTVRVEVIGKTVQKRDLHLVTVANFEKPGKRTVWLQARQHAWETGTSYVMEGALRFITSDDPQARVLREKVVFKFTPMMDPDGCANGKVRFNANGYDVNRHWDEVDLWRKEFLQRMPEIWYVKKAVLACMDSERKIDLMLNLHNTETAEYIATQADHEPTQKLMQRFFDALVAQTTFNPSRKLGFNDTPANTTNALWKERRVPVLLMEQRIGTSSKLGRRPTVQDRLAFGKQLIVVMAETVTAASRSDLRIFPLEK
ncbi:MAG TPA: M14-type cytosolic carboxypeptidase [Verrucomicrobiae bacterium]|nr:M14-type cytosolic carboxypeptidase [Verrucomicrobiae bacterium]